MRFARDVLNSFLRSGLASLESAPSSATRAAVETLLQMLSPFQFLLLREMSGSALIDAVRIVAEAIVSTPHGESLRFPAPLLITVGTSNFCPFSCSNCYSSSGPKLSHNEKAASVEMFHRIAASRTPFVMISGGEPLALPNIKELLKPLLDARKFIYVATNAALTPIASLLADCGKHLFILLPLWGTKNEHDRHRGTGSYERVERNLARLNQLDSAGQLLVVLSSNDLSVFDAVEDFATRFHVGTVLITRKLSVGRVDDTTFTFTVGLAKRVIERTRFICQPD
jgi:MoaA/NifB/PqqE/SkfB family radical SAM enzyme